MLQRLSTLGGLWLALLALGPAPAQALLLDWTSNPWPGTGVRTATFSVDGSDVIVTVSDPSNRIITGQSGPPSLQTNNYATPGTGAGRPHSLFIKTDENTASPYITVNILFTHAEGVTDVDFSFFDVDYAPLVSIFGFPISGYRDGITVTASDGVNTYDPTSITALTGTPSWQLVGTNAVRGTASNTESSNNGTALVQFDQTIRSLTFQYRNELSQGQLQWIGFSGISFRRAPEPGTALLLGAGLAALGAWRRPAAPPRAGAR
jgi:hypothetical protein